MARGNGAPRRWALVTVLVAILASLPALIGAWPASDDDRSADGLRAAALASEDVAFSGYAQSVGGLALPKTNQLGAVADLVSARTTMRVWWDGPAHHRVDVVTPGGETGVHRDATGTWTWEFEDNRVTRSDASSLALPAPPDLLPSSLARRLLSEAAPDELARLGADRVAGRDALGLRLVPRDAAASVGHVDIWVDATSGLPLRVRLFGRGAEAPALDTHFFDLDLAPPSAATIAFTPPPSARVQRRDDLGVLGNAARDLPGVDFPATLAGLPRRSVNGAPPAIALYGRGVTFLAAVPLPGRLGGDLRRAGELDPNAVRDELGTRLAAGPLGLMVVDPAANAPGRAAYLLTGTVTLDALAQAARELPPLGAAS